MYYGVLRQKDNWGLLAASLVLCSMRDHVPKNTVDRNLMICLHTTTHICAYTHTLTHAHMHTVHTCTQYTHAQTFVHTCAHVHTLMSTHMPTHIHTQCTHACTNIPVCTHTCRHTHKYLKNFLREQGSSFISVLFLHF